MRRKAVLLTIRPDTSEPEELVFALGAELVGILRQRRARPDPQHHLGSGKLEEARALVRRTGASLVVVDAALKPNQIFNLQRYFDHVHDLAAEPGAPPAERAADPQPLEVYDRTRLILEIFHQRAQSPEARLQVELAQIHYEIPLVKEVIHLAKKGEHPGFLAGGEYEVNQYHDMMKRRMARIRRELERLRLERGVRRKHRRRSGYHLVSLAGYTNAGKSSLLKALAGDPALVENRYFSTLGTRTRRARTDRREILLTDTVGFIEDLPPWLVEAFHSTLEEIALADLTLVVADASDPIREVARRLRSSLRILHEFDGTLRPRRRGAEAGAGDGRGRGGDEGPQGLAPLLIVLNKTDRLSAEELAAKVSRLETEGLLHPLGGPGSLPNWVAVSARTGEGFDELLARIYDLLPAYDLHDVLLPDGPETEAMLAWLHAQTDVLDVARPGAVPATPASPTGAPGQDPEIPHGYVRVRFESKARLRAPLARRLEQLHGIILPGAGATGFPEGAVPLGQGLVGSGPTSAGSIRDVDGEDPALLDAEDEKGPLESRQH